jgi:hypothetical protein
MGVSSESLKTYFAHLVDVARGDKQRGHAQRLPEIFRRASLTRNFPAAKSADEITPVVCLLPWLRRSSPRR